MFEWFEDAFRYIPSDPPDTPKNRRNTETTADFSQKRRNKPDQNVSGKMADSGQCFAVSGNREGMARKEEDPFADLHDPALNPWADLDIPPELDRRKH
jgi:hypothetical protein